MTDGHPERRRRTEWDATPRGSATEMRTAGVGVGSEAGPAAAEAALAAMDDLPSDAPITFATVFLSQPHADGAADAARAVARTIGSDTVVGVTAGAVLGGTHDYEDRPAVSVLVGSLPGVTAAAFTSNDLVDPAEHAGEPTADHPALAPDDPSSSDNQERERRVAASLRDLVRPEPETRGVMLLVDPYSVPMSGLARTLDGVLGEAAGHDEGGAARPRPPVFGGLASAGDRSGGNALICGERVQRHGFVGLTLSGDCRLDVVVSQGCTPVGPDLVVTKARGNMILGLAGRPALSVIRDIAHGLSEGERERLSGGVLLGRVANEYKERFGRGDYLIRGIVGADEDSGAIAASEQIRVGQTVRLHVRDARTSEQDLALLLDAQRLYERPAGALLFTCNGRGRALYNEPDKDVGLVQRAFAPPVSGEVAAKVGKEVSNEPNIPLAGFFAAGEIGPTGGQTHVHGQTACLALIRPPSE